MPRTRLTQHQQLFSLHRALSSQGMACLAMLTKDCQGQISARGQPLHSTRKSSPYPPAQRGVSQFSMALSPSFPACPQVPTNGASVFDDCWHVSEVSLGTAPRTRETECLARRERQGEQGYSE